MARIEMTSTEIQRDWSRVQKHIDDGDEVIVFRYSRAVAIITAYQEDTMNDTYIPDDLEDAPEFFTTADYAKNSIRMAIEGGGAADADDYDVDAIFDEAYEYQVDTDDQGRELLNTAGFVQVVSVEEFWEIVERHARTA